VLQPTLAYRIGRAVDSAENVIYQAEVDRVILRRAQASWEEANDVLRIPSRIFLFLPIRNHPRDCLVLRAQPVPHPDRGLDCNLDALLQLLGIVMEFGFNGNSLARRAPTRFGTTPGCVVTLARAEIATVSGLKKATPLDDNPVRTDGLATRPRVGG
jgi:hypothetical protein